MATIDSKRLLDGGVRPIVSVALPKDNVLQIFHIREGDNIEDARPGMHIRMSNAAEGTNMPLAFIGSFTSTGRDKDQNVLNSPPLIRIKAYSSVLEVRDIVEGEDKNLKPGAYYRWVRPCGSVAVPVIIEADGTVKILLQRVYRHQIASFGWELPMGGVNEGETPLEGMKRELREETGFAAEKITLAFEGYTDPGTSTARETFYIAEGLRRIGGRQDENETVEKLHPFSLNECLEMIDGKEIDRIESIAGIYHVYRMVNEGQFRVKDGIPSSTGHQQ